MPTLIAQPTRIEAAGNKPKLIDEYVGRVNSRHEALSVAHMRSPGGWVEPGQAPEFDEFTVVLKGMLRVAHRGGVLEVRAGQAVVEQDPAKDAAAFKTLPLVVGAGAPAAAADLLDRLAAHPALRGRVAAAVRVRFFARRAGRRSV